MQIPSSLVECLVNEDNLSLLFYFNIIKILHTFSFCIKKQQIGGGSIHCDFIYHNNTLS